MAKFGFKLDVGKEAKKTAKSDSSTVGKGVKSAMEGMGIGSGMTAIQGILQQFQPLISVAGGIFKLVTVLLSPISDLVIGLLIPIMLIIKPIALAVNQIMLPFFTQAVEFFRVGAETGDVDATAAGFSTLLAGINAVMVLLASQLLSVVLTLGLSVLADIVGIFSESGEAFIRDSLIGNIDALIQSMAASAIGMLALQVVQLGEIVDVDTTTFQNNIASAIGNSFTYVSDEWLDEFRLAMQTVEDEGLTAGMLALSTATQSEWTKLATEGTTAIFDAFWDMQSAITGFVGTTPISSGIENTFYSVLSALFPVTSAAVRTWRTYD